MGATGSLDRNLSNAKRLAKRGDVLAAQLKNLALAGAALLRGRTLRAAYVLKGAWDGQRGTFGKTLNPEDALTP